MLSWGVIDWLIECENMQVLSATFVTFQYIGIPSSQSEQCEVRKQAYKIGRLTEKKEPDRGE